MGAGWGGGEAAGQKVGAMSLGASGSLQFRGGGVSGWLPHLCTPQKDLERQGAGAALEGWREPRSLLRCGETEAAPPGPRRGDAGILAGATWDWSLLPLFPHTPSVGAALIHPLRSTRGLS